MSQTPTTIILVRHADVHNPADLVYGRLPRYHLSTIGRDEAARTAAALAPAPIAAIYSSPQLRARQTAQAIAALHTGLRVQVTQLLAEVRTGWQGTPNAEMAARQFNFYDPLFAPGDESLAAVTERMVRWIGRMLRRHPGQAVVGVSHGDPVMTVRLRFSGQMPSLATLRNPALYPTKGSITRLVFPTTGDPRQQQPIMSYDDPNATTRATATGGADAPWGARSEETKRAREKS